MTNKYFQIAATIVRMMTICFVRLKELRKYEIPRRTTVCLQQRHRYDFDCNTGIPSYELAFDDYRRLLTDVTSASSWYLAFLHQRPQLRRRVEYQLRPTAEGQTDIFYTPINKLLVCYGA